MIKRAFYIGIVILVSALGFGLLITSLQDYTYSGTVYESPELAKPIDLLGSNNLLFNIEDYRGKVVLIFFGYTSCPDVCPSTLSDMKRVVDILDQKADRIQIVFVTVDPERDNHEKLKSYLSLFNQKFLGLTGSINELEKVWGDYGVFREVDNTSETAAGYLVNHSSRLYLIDPNGRLFITYAFGTSPEAIAKDVEHIIKQN